jgi:hypothetical protein
MFQISGETELESPGLCNETHGGVSTQNETVLTHFASNVQPMNLTENKQTPNNMKE